MRWSTLWKVLAALAAAALVAAIASASTKEPAAHANLEPEFCTSRAVQAIVRDFVHAFNAGDRRALNFVWVRIRFQWYAETRPDAHGRARNHVEYTRRGMLRYLAQRHRRHERLRLTDFDFIGFNAAWGHFSFAVDRRADDLAGGRWTPYRGMGAVSCLKRPNGLARWTMAVAA